ncbi:MAG: hypothetical protein ACREVR_02630 [Burkholderiales bacterium]
MSEFPARLGNLIDTYGEVTSTSLGTAITASGSANTKGAWTQIIASTDHDARGIGISLVTPDDSASPGRWDGLIDIGIGAAASEQVIVPNLLLSAVYEGGNGKYFWFPLFIPKGTRLAARMQCSTASRTCYAQISLGSAVFALGAQAQKVAALGANTADSGGLGLSTSASNHTKGSWSEIVSSSAEQYNGLLLTFGHRAAGVSTDDSDYLIDIGVGAGGSEQVVIGDIYTRCEYDTEDFEPKVLYFPVSIPKGARIAARDQVSNAAAAAGNRDIDVVLYGVIL